MKKKKFRQCEPITIRPDGTTVFDLDCDELNANWMSSCRLMKRAETGDEEAKKELERRESSRLFVEVDEEE